MGPAVCLTHFLSCGSVGWCILIWDSFVIPWNTLCISLRFRGTAFFFLGSLSLGCSGLFPTLGLCPLLSGYLIPAPYGSLSPPLSGSFSPLGVSFSFFLWVSIPPQLSVPLLWVSIPPSCLNRVQFLPLSPSLVALISMSGRKTLWEDREGV